LKNLLQKILIGTTNNWKTSSIGLVLSFTGYVSMFPEGFDSRIVNFSKYTSVGGLATLGICSKDLDRH
jgi:hypothetical protein